MAELRARSMSSCRALNNALAQCGGGILAEHALDFRIDLVAVLFQRLRRHADAAKRHRVCWLSHSQADDLLQFLIDVTRRVAMLPTTGVRQERRPASSCWSSVKSVRDVERALGCRGEEGVVAEVRRVVAVDEVTDVDFFVQVPASKLSHALTARRGFQAPGQCPRSERLLPLLLTSYFSPYSPSRRETRLAVDAHSFSIPGIICFGSCRGNGWFILSGSCLFGHRWARRTSTLPDGNACWVVLPRAAQYSVTAACQIDGWIAAAPSALRVSAWLYGDWRFQKAAMKPGAGTRKSDALRQTVGRPRRHPDRQMTNQLQSMPL